MHAAAEDNQVDEDLADTAKIETLIDSIPHAYKNLKRLETGLVNFITCLAMGLLDANSIVIVLCFDLANFLQCHWSVSK